MGVHDGGDVVVPVDGEVQVDLGRRHQPAADLVAVEVDLDQLVVGDLAEHGAGGGDRHPVSRPDADVAGGSDEQAFGGQAVAREDQLPSGVVGEHSRTIDL